MKWQGGRRSGNVVDRRGMGRPAMIGGGLVGILGLIFAVLFGVDPSQVGLDTSGGDPSGYGGSGPGSGQPVEQSAEEAQLADFVSVVLADTEDTWPRLLDEAGVSYREPQLVMFRDAVQAGCGYAEGAMGPFYCPMDQKVYLDLSFFEELDRRFGAPGDFAAAYVIAHEVAHHVQTLLGISEEVHRAQQRASRANANALSVRLELQADCLAGVWAHHASNVQLEEGDVEEGLNAAAAIGDDTLQRRSGGRVAPESWTHGSSEQRVQWFKRGLNSGALSACDTFNAR